MTTLTAISNQSATVSALISTMENLTEYGTNQTSKIENAYGLLTFDLYNEKGIDPALVHNSRQDDINKLHAMLTLAGIFRDLADSSERFENFMVKSQFYEGEYRRMFSSIKLDVDVDEDDLISDDETEQGYEQRFAL